MSSQISMDKGQAEPPRPEGTAIPGTGPGLRGHPWLTLVTVAIGITMVALDGTIVAIANPAIQQDLQASLADVQWITNGYLLALAVALITAGKLGDRFGHRQTFLVGVVGFAASSGAIGLGGSVSLVVAFRVLQGLFGALLMPAALGLLRATFPAEKLNAAIGIWGAVIGASTAAGPIVGGLLVEHVSWESVFFINIPVGLLAVVMGLLILRDHRAENAPRSFDFPGIVLLSVAMFCLIWALIKAPEWGWGDTATLGFLAGALVTFLVFGVWESKASEPLLPLSMFRSVPLTAGTVLMVLMAFGFMGGIFFVTFYLQNVHGMSPVDSGVRLLPLTAMMIVASPLAGTVISKVGPRGPLVTAMVIAAVAMFGLSSLETDSSFAVTSFWFALLGLGLAPVMVGATEVIVGNAPLEHAGVAGGLQQAAMQVGGSLGTAVLGVVMASRVDTVLPEKWTDAKLPPLAPAQEGQLKSAAEVGVVPPSPEGTPEQIAAAVKGVVHDSFMSGMGLAFTCAGIVAVLAAGVAFFTKRGSADAGPSVHV
ncbi:drug resistance transporter, EmrB/QacA subfamily [Streptomyces sp. WMMB 714]|jgi:EmrB/QacA subfamily drug resistance transporter|uniref:MFS transporter n=1 Tax=Streptomyces sp. WMMB 714 TaxID=1286822 RepID=UPI0005F80049|nr:MFS transporter [Streptomyces sp. WMMB 714]SCK18244.1 drug resistance transporter, EmrB/QacA subfamily [Streptomyces sp. WMMB 714]